MRLLAFLSVILITIQRTMITSVTSSVHLMRTILITRSMVFVTTEEGGRSSARITLSRVVAGALAKLVLRQQGINVYAYTSQVGDIKLERDYHKYDLSIIESNPVRCPDPLKAREMEVLISQVKHEGDTIGGVISCVIKDAQ